MYGPFVHTRPCKRKCRGMLTLIGPDQEPLELEEARRRGAQYQLMLKRHSASWLGLQVHGSCATCSVCGDRPLMANGRKMKSWHRWCALCQDVFTVNGFWAEHGSHDVRTKKEKDLKQRCTKHKLALLELHKAGLEGKTLEVHLIDLPAERRWLKLAASNVEKFPRIGYDVDAKLLQKMIKSMTEDTIHGIVVTIVDAQQRRTERKTRHNRQKQDQAFSDKIPSSSTPNIPRGSLAILLEGNKKDLDAEIADLVPVLQRKSIGKDASKDATKVKFDEPIADFEPNDLDSSPLDINTLDSLTTLDDLNGIDGDDEINPLDTIPPPNPPAYGGDGGSLPPPTLAPLFPGLSGTVSNNSIDFTNSDNVTMEMYVLFFFNFDFFSY